ncbi:hypothetical protein KKD80_04065 [Patescibacteria group bacterium]|nr:hypothetical protein [Patescibacteria group bacterium]
MKEDNGSRDERDGLKALVPRGREMTPEEQQNFLGALFADVINKGTRRLGGEVKEV